MGEDWKDGPTTVIALATHNSAEFLGDLFESLERQSFSHFIIVASDDCSTDSTPTVLADYAARSAGRMKLLTFKEVAGGAMANFSRLFSAIDADYLFPCDHDDVWLPDKVQTLLRAIRDAEAGMGAETPLLVHSDLAVVDRRLNPLSASLFVYQNLPVGELPFRQRLLQNNVTGCAMVVNRALWKLALPIPADAIMHDWWFALVASAFGKVICLRDKTVLYRQHGTNVYGARAWNWRGIVERTVQYLRSRDQMRSSSRQAYVFAERYGDRLPPKDRIAVQDLANVWSLGRFERVWRLWRDGFRKESRLKTVSFFFALLIARRPG